MLGYQGYEASDFFAKASRWPDDMAKVPLDQPMGSMLASGQVVGRPRDGCSSVSSSGGLRGTRPAQPIRPMIPSQFIGDGLPDSCSSVSPLPVKKRVGVLGLHSVLSDGAPQRLCASGEVGKQLYGAFGGSL